MSMTTKKPAPVRSGQLTARATAAPTSRDSRWRWRIEERRAGQRPLARWSGRATDAELAAQLAEIHRDAAADATADDSSSSGTVADLLTRWTAAMEARADLAARSRSTYRGAARRLAAGLGHLALSDLDSAAIARWLDDEDRSARTVALDRRCLGAAWRWGRERDLVPDRDLRLPRAPRPPRRDPDPTPAEVDRCATWLAEHAPAWVSRALLVARESGARVGEVARLAMADVDLDTGRMRVSGKTGHRRVPISPRLRGMLQTRLDEGTAHDETVSGVARATVESGLGRWMHRAAAAVGLSHPPTPHTLRRHAADELARRGVDVGTAAAWLGHSPEVMLAIYRQVDAGDLDRAASRMWDADDDDDQDN